MDLIFLEPVYREKIWGGDKLKKEFSLDIPSSKTGEAWIISAHRNGVSKVTSPEKYRGMKLDELYRDHREIFGEGLDDTFPLLIKMLDASDNLSVQVHPDDEYARVHEGENELGKTECWYILSAEEGAEIVYGHNAKSREEFEESIKEGRWNDLLRRVKVKKGDFFDVPYGTIHAIGKGIVILETQQSSDTTYRLYDYDRVDDNGNTRELHLEDSINVSKIPHENVELDIREEKTGDSRCIRFLKNEFFSVYKYECIGEMKISLDSSYYLMTVIDGKGKITVDNKVYEVKIADSFIVPNGVGTMELEGDMEIIASKPE